MISGFGLPLAKQLRFTFPPSITDVFPVNLAFLGGTKSKKRRGEGPEAH